MSSVKLKGLRQITALQPETTACRCCEGSEEQGTQKNADNEEKPPASGICGAFADKFHRREKKPLKVVRRTKRRYSCKTSKTK